MTDDQELRHLKLVQARRRERPYNVIKGIIVFGIVMFFLGIVMSIVNGCGNGHVDTPAEQHKKQKLAMDLWAAHEAAHAKRIP